VVGSASQKEKDPELDEAELNRFPAQCQSIGVSLGPLILVNRPYLVTCRLKKRRKVCALIRFVS
jgi:hypothetical protein